MTKTPKPTPHLFMRMDAHHRLIVSLCVCAVVLYFTVGRFSVPSVILFPWMSFSLSVIIMLWITFLPSHPREVKKIARLQDSSRTMIFAFVIAGSLASLSAVYFLLKSVKNHSGDVNEHILLSVTAVFISW